MVIIPLESHLSKGKLRVLISKVNLETKDSYNLYSDRISGSNLFLLAQFHSITSNK